MEEPETTMVEVRQEQLMVSPTSQNQNPCSTATAHFLKPICSFNETSLPKLPSQCLQQPSFEPKALPLCISFHGWRCRAKNWSSWIEKMAPLHESTWRKAGIYEAIMNSTYHIKRNCDLVLGLAEKWCCETKSFVFSWGEASVTLEDVMILGGFSVLGPPVFTPVETEELKKVEESLKNARIEIVRSKAKKACPRLWMAKFMDSGSEIEHEAFLSFWLSRYVFTNAHETIREHVFSIAVHLARGTKLALAPSVLASLYRDLCLLKDAITASTKLGKEEAFTLTIWSPFQLVQVWAWERFVEARPKLNPIAKGQPRLARWHDVSCKVENVRLALESASESFEWRPYATPIDNWKQPKFYRENEVCISITPRLDKELESFARCLKVSELVGLDCVEQYLPHRVAMQFGMDQDIPVYVPRSDDETPEIAWLNYCESLTGVKLYIPSQLYKACVSSRYSKWWKQAVLESKGTGKGLKTSTENPKGKSSSGCHGLHKNIENDAYVSPNCSKKSLKKQGNSINETNDARFPLKKSKSVSQILEEKQVGDKGSSTPSGSYKRNSNKSAKNLKGNKKNESAKTSKRKKDDNESASPGLSKKRLKKSAEKSSGTKIDTPVSASSRFSIRSSKKSAKVLKDEEGSSDSAFHALPLVKTKESPATVKRKKGSGSFAPTGLAPKFDGKEDEDNSNPTIAEMMRSCKKRGKVTPKDYEEDGNLSGHSQSLSSTIADDEVVKYFEPLAILAEQAMHDEYVLRGVGAFQNACEEQKELETVREDVVHGETKATEHAHQIHEMISINDVEEECSCYAVDAPGLKLEARISRLEKLVEELKAMRSASK